jgi:hypothetical protein
MSSGRLYAPHVSSGVWVGAVATLAGAVLGGAISFLLSRQQIIEARAQREEEASRDKERRSVERRFDAYSDFLKRARSYRNVVRESVISEATFHDVDALAHAADSAGSLIPLVAESPMTIEACHRTLRAIRMSQSVVHNPDRDSRMARRSEAVDELVLSLRQFQAEAREELSVGGVDRSWILTGGRPVKSADHT